MGNHSAIAHDIFPAQGDYLDSRVKVCFHYDWRHSIGATVVRDDRADPWVTLFRLDDGRYVLASECQYAPE